MPQRTAALKRAVERIKAYYREDKLKHYTPFYRLSQDTRYMAEIEALHWAITQAAEAEGIKVRREANAEAQAG